MGAGTFADPKRPLLASFGTDKDDLLSYSWQPSDDGKLAIVEFVARDYSSLAKIVTDKRVVKAFEKGKHKPEDIELEIKKVKKEFTVDAFLRGGARR